LHTLYIYLQIRIMIAPLSALLLGVAGLTCALPTAEKRTVTALNQAAFAEAQKKDTTATFAFSAIEIKVRFAYTRAKNNG
jgi:hypothetical protein